MIFKLGITRKWHKIFLLNEQDTHDLLRSLKGRGGSGPTLTKLYHGKTFPKYEKIHKYKNFNMKFVQDRHNHIRSE